jgi:hypothetical protein
VPQRFEQQRPGSSPNMLGDNARPPPGITPQPLGMGMAPVIPSWGEAAPAYQKPPQQQQQQGMPRGYDAPFDPGFDPMLPQQPPPQQQPFGYGPGPMHGGLQGQYPQSGQQPLGHAMPMGMQGGPGGYGPHPSDPNAMQQRGMQPMHGQQAWMNPQGAPQKSGLAGALPKLTPQIILLVAVGAVCLAIFVIGIVLFVTTKF